MYMELFSFDPKSAIKIETVFPRNKPPC